MFKPRRSPAEEADYKTSLMAMSDKDLYEECRRKIWLSAYAANNPHANSH